MFFPISEWTSRTFRVGVKTEGVEPIPSTGPGTLQETPDTLGLGTTTKDTILLFCLFGCLIYPPFLMGSSGRLFGVEI